MAVSQHLKQLRPKTNIINEKFPNGQIIRPTMKGGLYLPILPNTEGQAYVSPNIKHSLVSNGQLCDDCCTVTFKIKDVSVVYKENMILQG